MPLSLITIEHSPQAPILTQVANSVVFPLSAEDKDIISQMKATLKKIQGVGLAAPQVGIAKKILVYAISEEAIALRHNATEIVPPTVLINARYEPTANAKYVADWEACFSVLEKTGKVPRYDQIRYFAQNEEGESIEAIAQGFTARVLQHEIDHLEGLLILDRLTPDCVQGHPDEMTAQRIRELNDYQKDILKKMIAEQENQPDPQATVRTKWISIAKKILEEKQN